MALKVVVDTSYHQFALAPLDGLAVVGIDSEEQLVALTESADALVVGLGVRDGKVEVSITSDPTEGWGPVEDEAEVILSITEDLWITSPTAENRFDPVFTPAQPGPHHVRVRARGRRENYDLSVSGKKPVEWYQIAIWPVE